MESSLVLSGRGKCEIVSAACHMTLFIHCLSSTVYDFPSGYHFLQSQGAFKGELAGH